MRILRIAFLVALQLWILGHRPVWAEQVSVRIVSDRSGAILLADNRAAPLGELPLSLRVTTPVPWSTCTSLSGLRVRWPGGTELAIGRIEVCPEDGPSQDVRITFPGVQFTQSEHSPRASTVSPVSTVVCHSAGLAYKPTSGNGCGTTSSPLVPSARVFARASSPPHIPIGSTAPPRSTQSGSNSGGKWRAVGRAIGAFAEGWAEAAAARNAYSPAPYLPAPHIPTPQVPATRSTTLSSNRMEPFTFYRRSDGVTGSSNTIGDFTFYNFSDGTRGTSNRIGSFTFHNLYRRGESVSGTTTNIGDFGFHNFSNGTSGTSSQIGDFTFHRFSDGTRCTTNRIGTFVNTTCN